MGRIRLNHLYIAGTALAIAFTMVIAEVYYVQVADIEPEVNRSTTLYCDLIYQQPVPGNARHATTISLQTVRDIFYPLTSPQCVSASFGASWWKMRIRLSDGVRHYAANCISTDPAYFDMYRFHFLEGRPFLWDEMDSRQRVAVITRDLADKVFGKDQEAVGRTMSINNYDWQVVGVVEAPPIVATHCLYELFVPYMAEGLLAVAHMPLEAMPFDITMVVPHDRRDAFNREIAEAEARYNASLQQYDGDVYGVTPAPADFHQSISNHYQHVWDDISLTFDTPLEWGESDAQLLWFIIPSILLLLIVPALNLSGMVAAGMQTRLSELALRRAFGARRSRLLWEVLTDNLRLTLVGGAIGLVVAWVAIYFSRSWIFTLFLYDEQNYSGTTFLTSEMLFAPAIFLITLIICIVLNTLAALLPALLTMRKPIVESLNQKQ